MIVEIAEQEIEHHVCRLLKSGLGPDPDEIRTGQGAGGGGGGTVVCITEAKAEV